MSTIVTFPGMAPDGYIYGQHATYSFAQASGIGGSISENVIYVGQRYVASPGFTVWRGYLKFDTSTMPASAKVLQANIRMVCTNKWVDTHNFDVEFRRYNWSTREPLTDNLDSAYDGILAAASDVVWKNTSAITINTQYTSPNLNTSWITPAGYTYYGLLTQFNGIEPSDNEYISIASQDHANSAYRPVLIVEYEVPTVGPQAIFWE
jgi:hypothetical protein